MGIGGVWGREKDKKMGIGVFGGGKFKKVNLEVAWG